MALVELKQIITLMKIPVQLLNLKNVELIF